MPEISLKKTFLLEKQHALFSARKKLSHTLESLKYWFFFGRKQERVEIIKDHHETATGAGCGVFWCFCAVCKRRSPFAQAKRKSFNEDDSLTFYWLFHAMLYNDSVATATVAKVFTLGIWRIFERRNKNQRYTLDFVELKSSHLVFP